MHSILQSAQMSTSHVDKAALMAMEEYMSSEAYMRHFRRVAFIAVALSTVTMLGCIVVMPLSYQYIQRVHSSVTNDIDFCRSRNRDLWSEVVTVHLGKGLYEQADRLKRDTAQGGNGRWLFGHYIQNNGEINQHAIRRQAPYEQGPGNAGAGSTPSSNAGYGNAAGNAPVSNNNAGYGPSGNAPVGNAGKSQSGGKECCACQIGPAGAPGWFLVGIV
jgi:hypothetical protein